MRLWIMSLFIAASANGPAAAETPFERGAYLVEGPVACGNCHTSPVPGAAPYAGQVFPQEGWSIVAQNITPSGRVAAWSDDELRRAIRECIRPDGTVIGPPMPCGLYRGISDSDLDAIVAYIRSLEPMDSDLVASTQYPFALPSSYGPPIDTVPDVPRGVTVAYGAYLVGPIAHCTECHSLTKDGPGLETNYGGGGYVWEGPWGLSVAANITSHADGLGDYTDAEIKQMIKGIRTDGSDMSPPMAYAYYTRISDTDLDAIVAYLRTIPPLPGN